MLYFRIVVVAAAAAAAYCPSLLYRNMVYSYGLFVRYHAIVPSVVVFYCLNENE